VQFWEGAILLVGGIWLVGRMHRIQVQSLPVSMAVSTPARRVPGPTSATNTDGSGYLVSGETLNTGTGRQPALSGSCPTCTGLPITNYKAAGAVAYPRYQKPLAVQF
jgi:hypothetical protein